MVVASPMLTPALSCSGKLSGVGLLDRAGGVEHLGPGGRLPGVGVEAGLLEQVLAHEDHPRVGAERDAVVLALVGHQRADARRDVRPALPLGDRRRRRSRRAASGARPRRSSGSGSRRSRRRRRRRRWRSRAPAAGSAARPAPANSLSVTVTSLPSAFIFAVKAGITLSFIQSAVALFTPPSTQRQVTVRSVARAGAEQRSRRRARQAERARSAVHGNSSQFRSLRVVPADRSRRSCMPPAVAVSEHAFISCQSCV